MLAVPPVLLEILSLQPGAKVDMAVERGRLIVEAKKKPRYTMKELLAKCNAKAPTDTSDLGWVTSKQVGRELL